jgi:hypothetical protein
VSLRCLAVTIEVLRETTGDMCKNRGYKPSPLHTPHRNVSNGPKLVQLPTSHIFDVPDPSADMAKVPIPFQEDKTADELVELVNETGTMRKAEIEQEVEATDERLNNALVQAVERGDIALFPVGGTVQVRDETEP